MAVLYLIAELLIDRVGLQAVTKAKLGFDPLEVNPEDMVRFAIEQPQVSFLVILVLRLLCLEASLVPV